MYTGKICPPDPGRKEGIYNQTTWATYGKRKNLYLPALPPGSCSTPCSFVKAFEGRFLKNSTNPEENGERSSLPGTIFTFSTLINYYSILQKYSHNFIEMVKYRL